MSDIREALDALKKLYVAQERPDRADLYNTVKAALSANGGEAVPLAGIVQVASTCFKQVLPWDEAKRQHASILSASDSLGSPGDGAELIPLYTHPAPPSVAVPEIDSHEMNEMAWAFIGAFPAGSTRQELTKSPFVKLGLYVALSRLRTAGDEDT